MALSLNRHRGFRGRLGLVAAVACAAVACVRDNTADSAAGGPPPAGPPPLVLAGDAPWPARYGGDATWSRAAAHDDFALARLAHRESAESLLAAVNEGGSLGRVALAALPYAPDRHAARGGLCALLPRADAAGRSLLLEALLDVVIGAPMTDDSLDPAADALCARELDAAARLEPQAAIDRDRAHAVRAQLRAP
jgi:hypothetical protein